MSFNNLFGYLISQALTQTYGLMKSQVKINHNMQEVLKIIPMGNSKISLYLKHNSLKFFSP